MSNWETIENERLTQERTLSVILQRINQDGKNGETQLYRTENDAHTENLCKENWLKKGEKGVTERLFTYIMNYKGVGAKGMKDVTHTK